MATSSSQPIKARVNRAFYMSGRVLAVGDTVDLPPALASELYAAGKIERADMSPSVNHAEALAAAKAKAERKSGGKKPAARE